MVTLLAMEERGKSSGIKDNQYHKQYNDSTLKVYLMDKYIKDKTVGMKSIMDFEVTVDNKGQIAEYRILMKVTFILTD